MKSIRDIYKIGVGPSSSHTMGPERAAKIFYEKYPDADRYRVTLYGSLSKTGVGHGTDRVIREVLSPLPTEIVFSKESPEGFHPNTMDFFALKDGKEVGKKEVRGNYLRLAVCDVEPTEADEVKIHVLATNGAPAIKVYEVRIY